MFDLALPALDPADLFMLLAVLALGICVLIGLAVGAIVIICGDRDGPVQVTEDPFAYGDQPFIAPYLDLNEPPLRLRTRLPPSRWRQL